MRLERRPGTGKTLLASFPVKHSSDQTDKTQLLHNDEALYCDVESSATKSGRATADPYVEVHSALILALAKTTRTILILIDALNESPDTENHLQALSEANRIVEWKATMRLPVSYGHYISFDSNTSQQPILKYIDYRVLQLKTLSDGVLGLIIVGR